MERLNLKFIRDGVLVHVALAEGVERLAVARVDVRPIALLS